MVADFRLFAGGALLYRDADLPVVELARALAAWAARVTETAESFSFDTRSSALRSLFRISRGIDGWYLTSLQQPLPSSSVFSLEEVLTEVRRFVVRVESEVFRVHGFSALGLRP